MTNEQYQELKSIIHKAVPEILELKFGCEVEVIRNQNKVAKVVSYYPGHTNSLLTFCYGGFDYETRSQNFEPEAFELCFKILGRPIRISDVLVAIRESKVESIFIRQDGTIFKWEKFTEGGSGHHGVESTYINWRISTDDLDAQSEKCKQFLYDLLKGAKND